MPVCGFGTPGRSELLSVRRAVSESGKSRTTTRPIRLNSSTLKAWIGNAICRQSNTAAMLPKSCSEY
jgi:hypothetical protein